MIIKYAHLNGQLPMSLLNSKFIPNYWTLYKTKSSYTLLWKIKNYQLHSSIHIQFRHFLLSFKIVNAICWMYFRNYSKIYFFRVLTNVFLTELQRQSLWMNILWKSNTKKKGNFLYSNLYLQNVMLKKWWEIFWANLWFLCQSIL